MSYQPTKDTKSSIQLDRSTSQPAILTPHERMQRPIKIPDFVIEIVEEMLDDQGRYLGGHLKIRVSTLEKAILEHPHAKHFGVRRVPAGWLQLEEEYAKKGWKCIHLKVADHVNVVFNPIRKI